ncbi:MAG: signal peptidase II [Anaerolineae bacterium]|nr:signal peptidase II [Anaerolineae bacterium]
MRILRKLILVLLVLFLCVGCDQATKSVARAHLPAAQPLRLLGDTLQLQYTENLGAFLGLGSSLPAAVRFWILIVMVSASLTGTLIFILVSPHLTNVGFLGGALVVGGGFSNLLDRIHNGGAVVDFINIGVGRLRTGIFNVADLAIMLGIGLLLSQEWGAYRGRRTEKGD